MLASELVSDGRRLYHAVPAFNIIILPMRVLGIETSCDETGIALYDTEQGLLADALYSQIAVHSEYGGVVPELASRDHVRKTLPLIEEVLHSAGLSKQDLDAIAYTAGPGLVGALMVGAAVGRSMAYALGIPAVGVHHMEGHLLAPMLEDNPPAFPFVALLVSGGHTQLVQVDGIGRYQLLGESLDDAAGEAFDKAAKMMDLDYPGGPHIARLAERGTPGRFTFPRPMTDRPGSRSRRRQWPAGRSNLRRYRACLPGGRGGHVGYQMSTCTQADGLSAPGDCRRRLRQPIATRATGSPTGESRRECLLCP